MSAFHFAADLSPSHLLEMARIQGITALGVKPVAGLDCKILLASIVDVRAPGVRDALVQLNCQGAIVLTRVDETGLIPTDRIEVWQASKFVSLFTRFDCIAFDGKLLVDHLDAIGRPRGMLGLAAHELER
jgi:hypothetical protein